eukprot:3164637-Rhodomonas_salina.1
MAPGGEAARTEARRGSGGILSAPMSISEETVAVGELREKLGNLGERAEGLGAILDRRRERTTAGQDRRWLGWAMSGLVSMRAVSLNGCCLRLNDVLRFQLHGTDCARCVQVMCATMRDVGRRCLAMRLRCVDGDSERWSQEVAVLQARVERREAEQEELRRQISEEKEGAERWKKMAEEVMAGAQADEVECCRCVSEGREREADVDVEGLQVREKAWREREEALLDRVKE